jgi:hypothetical protein
LDPLNLGAILPKDPKNPLARLIPPQTPTKTVELLDGSRLEVEDPPLPKGALDFIRAAKVSWAQKELRARGEL